MFRAYGELKPTPDGVFNWEGESMPFQRGRRPPEPPDEPAPKLPMFSRWEPSLAGRNAPGHVRVAYKDAGEDVAGNTDWQLALVTNSDPEYPEYESDPDKIYDVDATGTRRKRGQRYGGGHFIHTADAETATWRAYQHDTDWRSRVLGSGATLDDDRYIPDDTTDVDEIDEDNDEYVWINRVVHRLSDGE